MDDGSLKASAQEALLKSFSYLVLLIDILHPKFARVTGAFKSLYVKENEEHFDLDIVLIQNTGSKTIQLRYD